MKTPSKQSLETAAQCWCDEETKNTVMDSTLAVAFANRLDEKDKQITILWDLLDDISTAGDMFKPEHTAYFKYVNKKCEERSVVAESLDGYELTIKPVLSKYRWAV